MTITEPPILSIIEPNNIEAPIDIVVRALCPVRCPSLRIASYSQR